MISVDVGRGKRGTVEDDRSARGEEEETERTMLYSRSLAFARERRAKALKRRDENQRGTKRCILEDRHFSRSHIQPAASFVLGNAVCVRRRGIRRIFRRGERRKKRVVSCLAARADAVSPVKFRASSSSGIYCERAQFTRGRGVFKRVIIPQLALKRSYDANTAGPRNSLRN